jgi:hypothetical protein
MTKKLNHAWFKRKFVGILLQYFIDSGKEYTCQAVIHNVCHDLALKIAKLAVSEGYRFSKTNYPFAEIGNTARIFLSAVGKEYHEKIYLQKE